MSNTPPSGPPKHKTVGSVIADLENRLEKMRATQKRERELGEPEDDPLTVGIVIGFMEAIHLMKQCRYRPPKKQASS